MSGERRDYKAMYPNHVNPAGCETLLGQTGLALRFGVKPGTAAAWAKRPDFPAPTIISMDGHTLWDVVTVTEWYEMTMLNNKLHHKSRSRYNNNNNQ